MAFIPNNSIGGNVVSKGTFFFEKALSLGVGFGLDQTFTSDWFQIQGMPNIALSANGTADGNNVDYPDSTIGQVIVRLEIASGNAGEFEAGQALSGQKIGEWTCPMTDDQTFDVPVLYQVVQVPTKYVRIIVSIPSGTLVNNYAKLYVRLHASA
jgi:hypothetical protein